MHLKLILESYRSNDSNMVHFPLYCLHLTENIMLVQKPSHVHKKDGSSVKAKSSMLENAIRELEKMVAECKLQSSCRTSIPSNMVLWNFVINSIFFLL